VLTTTRYPTGTPIVIRSARTLRGSQPGKAAPPPRGTRPLPEGPAVRWREPIEPRGVEQSARVTEVADVVQRRRQRPARVHVAGRHAIHAMRVRGQGAPPSRVEPPIVSVPHALGAPTGRDDDIVASRREPATDERARRPRAP